MTAFPGIKGLCFQIIGKFKNRLKIMVMKRSNFFNFKFIYFLNEGLSL